MSQQSLTIRTAQKHVKNYSGECDALMKEHRAAMYCRDCEAFLLLGIDAFDWLIRADKSLRSDLAEDASFDCDNIFQRLESDCRQWLKTSELAESWIRDNEKNGYQVDKSDQFRKCYSEMRSIVAFFDADAENGVLPDAMAKLRDEALSEHANDQTAEFLPEEE